MLDALKGFIGQYFGEENLVSSNPEHTLELCAAVLMLEIAFADSKLGEEEKQLIEEFIAYHFHLDTDETTALMKQAVSEVDHAISLRDFTRVINASLSPEEKATVIELLWRVANADNVIDKYEEYYIRKIADLLYVSHSDYIKAKHRASV
jgi:uncharacterized tellurite resistance protein B-like protein